MDIESSGRKSARSNHENSCNVCHLQFSLSNRSGYCSKCFQKTCKVHLTKENEQTLCELCIKIEYKKEFFQKKQEQVKYLKNELRGLQHREQANMKEISLKTESIEWLEKTIKENQGLYDLKIQNLEASISNEEKEFEKSNIIITQINEGIQLSEFTQKYEQIKFLNSVAELNKIQKDRDSVYKEYKELRAKEKKLIEENNKMITLQRIRTITCVNCYNEIAIKFKEEIIQILSRKGKKKLISDVLAIKTKEPDNVTGSSCKCLIY